ELHHEERERRIATVDAGLEDLRDARMLQPSERLRLAREAPQRVTAERAGTHRLQRDAPRRLELLGGVDDAHAAGPDLADDAVTTGDDRALRERCGGRGAEP